MNEAFNIREGIDESRKRIKHMYTSLSFIPLTIIICALVAHKLLDPDLGWHLKMGEYVSNHGGVPDTDPFSYTMASFPFIDHEWLTNFYLFKFYNLTGKIGLSMLFSIYFILAIMISFTNKMSREINKSVRRYSLIMVGLLAFPVFISYFGVRPQVQSWLLFSILFYVLFNPRVWNRYKFLLVPLMIFWTNLHGSFAAGVATILAFVVFRSIRLRKLEKTDVFLSILIILSTFVNAYGPRIWEEVWMQVSDSNLRWTIQEWQPSIFDFNPPLLIVATTTSFLLWKYKSKFFLEEKVIYIIFLSQAVLSTRHVPLWLILQIPIFVVSANYLYEEIKPIPMAIERLTKMYKLFIAIIITLFIFEISLFALYAKEYSVDETYPVGAVSYLGENSPEGQILSPYNWGGYLIWKYPQKKLYVDGRMPSWRWDEAPADESAYAMRDYKDLVVGETDYKQEFEKYGIDTVLWFAPKEESLYEKIDNIIYKYLERFSQGDKDKKELLESLVDDGWVVVYEDDTALIYQKP